MVFQPTHAERIGSAEQRLNHSATLPDRRSIIGKLNRTKKKWSKGASLQIEYFFPQNKKRIKSSPCSIKSKILTSMYLNSKQRVPHLRCFEFSKTKKKNNPRI